MLKLIKNNNKNKYYGVINLKFYKEQIKLK